MKNKFTARLCVLMCLVLIISSFAACSVKPDNGNITTLVPGNSWSPDSNGGYEPVTISKVELVDLVEEVLGDQVPENFNGNLNTLTPEQIQKVEDYAEDKGLIVDKDDSGNTVIKKEEIPTTQASQDEVNQIFSQASVKDPSNLTPDEIEEISKIANDQGLVVQTKPEGDGVVIVKPVTTTQNNNTTKKSNITTTRILTSGTTMPTTKKPEKTTNGTPKTTAVYNPPSAGTVSPMGQPLTKVSSLVSDWAQTFGASRNNVFVNNDATSDGGAVSVGITYTGTEKEQNSAGLIVKYNEKGKVVWSNTLSGDSATAFEHVAVLKDGSIIAVGHTMAKNIASPNEYECAGTVEGVVAKYSAKGDHLWTKILGGSDADMVYAAAATSDGGFIIGGKTISADGDFSDLGSNRINAFIYKCSSDGSVVWKNSLSGTKHSAVEDIAIGTNGDIYATIDCMATDGDYTGLLPTNKRSTVIIKLSSAGKKLWVKSLYDNGLSALYSIAPSDDGGCVVAGHYSSPAKGNEYAFKGIYNGGMSGTFDGMIVKFDANGTPKWKLPLVGFEGDYVTGITQIPGGYAVAGYTASTNRDFPISNKGDYDSFVYTISLYGEIGNVYHFGGSNSDNARAICSDGKSIFVSGSTNSADGDYASLSPAGSSDVTVCFNKRFAVK